ncbi:MAG: haloalkane dehalogenase [Ilumatobacter sp.]|uniref:haloalkane dehalogenase n=1 Tax=Ilumatobacter sp. TaxID=1967498 RepID=UPI0039199875
MNQHATLPPDVSADDAEILWTATGRPFVRTPDDCLDGLPDYPWEPRYAPVDGMRMHYVDAGDPDGEVVLLLHGQPDWSYLYRKMIPVLAGAGLRVIAPDLIGFGKSDKPVQLADYRFLHHVAWVEEFIDVLGLDAITPVVQDWGSLIGLRCVGNRPDRFARVVVANGNLLVLPEGVEILTLPDSLEPQDLAFPDVISPGGGMGLFEAWATYALVGRDFMPSVPMRATINADLTDAEFAAYDAPFPSRIHMAGPRTFPSLVNTVGDAPTNEAARAALEAFDRPVLGCFGLLDPIFGTPDSIAATREQIAGAVGQPHHDYPDAGHMIQEDVGADLAARIAAWMHDTPDPFGSTR